MYIFVNSFVILYTYVLQWFIEKKNKDVVLALPMKIDRIGSVMAKTILKISKM